MNSIYKGEESGSEAASSRPSLILRLKIDREKLVAKIEQIDRAISLIERNPEFEMIAEEVSKVARL